MTLIALKREVAAGFRRFSVERMSSFQTDDKSLYRVGPLIRKQRVAPVCQKACRGLFVWQEDGNARKRVHFLAKIKDSALILGL